MKKEKKLSTRDRKHFRLEFLYGHAVWIETKSLMFVDFLFTPLNESYAPECVPIRFCREATHLQCLTPMHYVNRRGHAILYMLDV